ncbi:hexitol phosphatase HxpB [Shewanella submarina]|uniref:Hexitol phosphatase HxpB n=1 Tax=Shewanella submarina TaxID=2016376 RepID=A0ABV7G511_9GAMM|nr:hexitol phosphatase HxpB [Shewanella submarina]
MVTIQLKAVIFDMDGVLIDSEPLWQLAELDVFHALGMPLTLEETHLTTGLRVDQLVEYWYARKPWQNYDKQATANAIADSVVGRILAEGQPMPHVLEALQACRAAGVKVGLATSSPMNIVNAVLDSLKIRDCFDGIESAELLKYGKPHPEVYLNCADSLGVSPANCVAVEDSFNGLIAARAANMQTVVIPAVDQAEQARWAAAHHQFSSLAELKSLLA